MRITVELVSDTITSESSLLKRFRDFLEDAEEDTRSALGNPGDMSEISREFVAVFNGTEYLLDGCYKVAVEPEKPTVDDVFQAVLALPPDQQKLVLEALRKQPSARAINKANALLERVLNDWEAKGYGTPEELGALVETACAPTDLGSADGPAVKYRARSRIRALDGGSELLDAEDKLRRG